MDKQVLPKAFRDAWLKALRSEEYKQGMGVLRTHNPDGTDCFCCLGVAADIVDNSLWGQTDIHGDYEYGLNNYTTYRGPDGVFRQDFASKLVCMNDDEGSSFIEIADWIEQNTIEGEEKDA
jgi:hypothetical protein